MSLHLEFTPHSWYMGFAIKKAISVNPISWKYRQTYWEAYTDDGNTYQIVELEADTLSELKAQIRHYHESYKNSYYERYIKGDN